MIGSHPYKTWTKKDSKPFLMIVNAIDAIDAIDERETAPEDKWKKIIKLLHSKGLGVEAESLAEPITEATFEGAKTTILYHWEQTKNSEKQNLNHHFQTAKAIFYTKETFCKSDDQNASFSKFILENCGLSSR